jgi:hypothetical protein
MSLMELSAGNAKAEQRVNQSRIGVWSGEDSGVRPESISKPDASPNLQ